MSNLHFSELLNRYLDGSLSASELSEFMNHLQQEENHQQLQQAIQQSLERNSYARQSEGSRSDIIFQKILEEAHQHRATTDLQTPIAINNSGKFFKMRWMFAVAAVVLVFFSIAYVLLLNKKTADKKQVAKNIIRQPENDVPPGADKATLTLANGSVIVLDKSAKGTLALQGNTKIIQLNAGQLAYNTSSKNATEVFYNTISTPRGGQYELILPDGSKVWLNAASSLKFPTAFVGKERNVVLTGEAYFEISKNKEMPFRVNAGEMQVEVLGTHFNVNAYTDEAATKTTLLEGAVKIIEGKSNEFLKPGQQAALNNATSVITVNEADVDQVVAWKNGLFEFSSDDIQTIMRQLGRWYDVEISYEGKIPSGHFSGAIGRYIPISQVLKMLEVNDVHFRIDGKKIIVL